MNKKGLYLGMVVVLLGMLFVLSSCTAREGTRRGFLGIGEGSNKVTVEDHLKGEDALVISLEDPRTITVSPGERIFYGLSMENKGATDITSMTTLFSGFDPAYISAGFSGSAPSSLEGKTQYGPGQRDFYSVEGSASEIQGLRLNQDITLNICYPYKTQATFEVCVDANGRADPNGCPRDSQYTLSGGQGGPIAIDSVTYNARRTADGSQGTFVLHFSQLSSANNMLIVDDSKTSSYCQSNVQDLNFRQDQGVVTIKKIMLGNIDVLASGKCPSLQDGNKLNIDRRKDLICYVAVADTADYTTSFTIEVGYGIKQSVTQPVLIQKLLA